MVSDAADILKETAMIKCTAGKISSRIFQFNEANILGPYVDSYLYIGEEKAVVIDALETAENLYESVRNITDLPLEVLLTHGHRDHAGKGLHQFFEAGIPVWMREEDIPLYRTSAKEEPHFLPLKEGQIFDLGDRKLETVFCAGHTPGSAVFFDRENGYLFSGDSVGSGHFWMQLKHSLPLHEFRTNLQNLIDLTENTSDLRIYPGHRNQSPVQLNRQYLLDEAVLIDRILSGKETAEKKTMRLDREDIVFCEGHEGLLINMCYDPENL